MPLAPSRNPDTPSLSIGHVLAGHYRVEQAIGSGGVGFTYKATDDRLGTTVAVKELCPPSLARREATGAVVPGSDAVAASLDLVRTAFLRETRSIAMLDDPAIPRIFEVFEENGTVYSVARFVDGRPLKDWLALLGRPPTQAELDRLLADILRGLELIHGQGILHRDISAASILVTDDGHAVLVDFGNTRQILSSSQSVLGAIVKQGYAPPEQYAHDARLQGPWTDIYALGATLYEAVTGRRPPDATERMLDASVAPSAAAAGTGYRSEFLSGIDAAMALRPLDRPQTIAELRRLLSPEHGPASRTPLPARAPDAAPAAPAGAARRRPTGSAREAPSSSPAGGFGGWLGRLFGRGDASDRRDVSDEPRKKVGGGPSGLVQCSVFAPPSAAAGTTLLVQVFLHPPTEAARVETIARAFDDAATKRQTGMLAAPVAVGQRVDIAVVATGLAIDEPHQHVVWRGVTEAANFVVSIPSDAGARDHFPVVLISIDGVPHGRLVFKLTSTATRRGSDATAVSVGLVGTPYRRAFCSYSSRDVVEVTRAVQVLSLLGWSCFHDKSSLTPGQRYATALREEVERSDLFLLFWSSAARQSEWVRREAEWALAKQGGSQGVPDILPVILEGPPPAPPFEFLSDRHFDDRYQYMIAALRGRPEA